MSIPRLSHRTVLAFTKEFDIQPQTTTDEERPNRNGSNCNQQPKQSWNTVNNYLSRPRP